jgi:predicted HAD superfamily Cof-like phosphohydrolase
MNFMPEAIAFRRAMGQTIGSPTEDEIDLQFDLIKEEYEELTCSCDEAETLKEMADLVYVLYQLAAAKAWNLDAALYRVHKSNLSKLVNGKPLRREDGKVLKGPNYKPPYLDDLIQPTK